MKWSLIVAVCALCALPATAAALSKTTVTINNYNFGNDKFYGSIKSSKVECKDDRRVIMYRRVPGPDVKVGANRSKHGPGNSYFWTVKEESPTVADPYYAKVKKTGTCAADRSDDFIFP